ncbi:septal ring lytic transglycosylase RlpA family protein [Spirulina subsalsa]|uniref:septal ring lytic transglycosylase RlpA family protein n=1 Tax=Spirulina subsalsa TaxID=54311 RepID=UPI000367645F|nr:septal ring lytic transglycosylase RlpA family protein [Spirulina subsalsa]
MTFFRLAWVTSCVGILLGFSQFILTDSRLTGLRLASAPKNSHLLSYSSDWGSWMPSAPWQWSWATTGLHLGGYNRGQEPPLEVAFQRLPETLSSWETDFRSYEGVPRPLRGKIVSWQNSAQDGFCPPAWSSTAQWSQRPQTEKLGQSQPKLTHQTSLRERLSQVVENVFHWSKMTQEAGNVVKIAQVVNGETRKLTVPERLQWVSGRSQPETPSKHREEFHLLVNGQTVMKLENRQQIEDLAERLRYLLNKEDLDPTEIKPSLLGGNPAGMAGDRLLFLVDSNITPLEEPHRELMVIHWVNHLRQALGAEALSLVEAQRAMYSLVETRRQFEGLASWYGPYFHGRMTANGEIYDQEAFTAAHPYLPFNTYLKVTNLESQESVIVRINDRGPYIYPRTLDLSRGVARCLDSKQSGVVRYRAVVMESYSRL